MPSPDRACLEIEHIFHADDDVLRHTVIVGFSGTPYITRQVPTPDELARRKQPGPDEAQEVQRLTQRRIFREQQEEMRPLLRDLLRNAYEQGARATGVICYTAPRSRNSIWRATRTSWKRQRRRRT
jgi:hypothetical protein